MAAPAAAQPSEASLYGVLRAGDPVEGATITVTDADGNEVERATTDAEGRWSVAAPEPGEYTATLDVESLPEGVTLTDPSRAVVTRTVGTGATPVPFPLRAGAGGGPGADDGADSGPVDRPRPSGSTTSDLERVARATVNGLQFGLIIAITSVGLSLIFGTTGLVNFAHGELVAFGAIVAWQLNTNGPELHLAFAAVIAALLGAVLGAVLERGLWRPLRVRNTGRFQLLVISIGLSLVLRPALLIWFGGSSRRYQQYGVQTPYELGPISITPRDLSVMALSLLCLLAVAYMLQRTRVGKAMRAVSDDVDLAESSGIDVQRIILVVWVLGAGLAAVGGVFQGTITSVNYLNGQQLLLLMFAAVILGGLGTAYGAMVGGLVVGLATEVSTVWLSAELKYVWALAVLVAVLLVRPQGILGERERVG